MTSSQTRATVSSSSSQTSRSFLSRLKSPLSSKSRNYTEFYIQSDDPHRQYSPGDIISGTVIIKIIKPLRITHLVVSLHGYAQVFKNPNAPGDAYKNYCTTVGSGKGKKAGSYFGNGFVSLFEDEVVLCGEGRLSEGVYHFNFELEFPSKGLPSSIDFERGTVSYMLTATMTRPTTISPTTSCDTKVYLMDTIDIAPIPEPKPRIVSLEPISRRTRAKPSRKRQVTTATDGGPRTPNGSEAPYIGSPSEVIASPDEHESPRSPSPSDVSFESQMSSGNASGTEYGVRSVNTATDGFSSQNASRTILKGKTITATVDVLKGGFLRGDQIPIRVTVQHTKHVRSLKGIIITLYRQARVDMHPALPVVPNSKGDRTKSEDYYPKSRTGLGGLSLSSAGSSHLFRKDLCQSFAPLFVDPRTLTAEVKCAVRVPDEAFPTISNVPGAMISFKYYVEVVVDIQGKLTGLDRMVANAGLVNVPTITGGASGTARDDSTSNMFSTWGGNFVDTDQIRREKGIVSSLFEVVIGTKDSERNGKRKQTQEPLPNGQSGVYEVPLDGSTNSDAANSYDQDYYGYDEDGQYYDYSYDPAYYDIPEYEHTAGADTSSHIPPAPSEEEQGLSEKERMRRAEARLLPSQPPGAAGPASPPETIQHGIPASAPVLPEDEDPNTQIPYFTATAAATTPAHPPPPFHASAPSQLTSGTTTTQSLQRRVTGQLEDENLNINGNSQDSPAPQNTNCGEGSQLKPLPPLPPQSSPGASGVAPEYLASSASHFQASDDKQELRRQRLEMERSAPPEDDEQGESSQNLSAPLASCVQSVDLAPSAPILDEDDEGLVGAMRPGRSAQTSAPVDRRHSEALPEYQR
ncbi:Nn.00g100860.m01.CDS01 [Neocucurbitaria sp. VM-36]